MINIAIVEDNDTSAEELQEYLARYQTGEGGQFYVVRYTDAVSFLSGYNNTFEIVLMDIEMPGLNGFDAAVKLRKFDKEIVIIFITNMSQFAKSGYEVDALDFIVKPLNYQDFYLKLQKAINRVKVVSDKEITIPRTDGFYRVASNKLLYIEVADHKLIYHLADNKIEARGSLRNVEKSLRPLGFFRCNHCFLVNLKHVEYVKGLSVKIYDKELSISRPKHKAFIIALAEWYMGNAKKHEI